ncbi:unnamed protein product [Citrullus colocynthis]|uniref:Uncharacterized protein n=1 Tax=Citrullus colocynthis TaxID=252529 RepID=A0ABP0Z2T8_9ROSI
MFVSPSSPPPTRFVPRWRSRSSIAGICAESVGYSSRHLSARGAAGYQRSGSAAAGFVVFDCELDLKSGS